MVNRGPRIAIALLFAATAVVTVVWGFGALKGASPRVTSLQAGWCRVHPLEQQSVLVAEIGAPRVVSPGDGRNLGLNISHEMMLQSVQISVPKGYRYAVWSRGGYLMADTYARSGAITGMFAWRPNGVMALGCQAARTGSNWPVTRVPSVVGETVSNASAALTSAYLSPGLAPGTGKILRQDPNAGLVVPVGTLVRFHVDSSMGH